ncbi:MAG: TatD family hydrolase [Bacteroidota bacterium]
MEWIDTHAHIYDEKFKEDTDDILNRCQEVGVRQIYMPNIDQTTIDAMLELEHRYPEQCIPMMGLHPCSVKKDFERGLYLVEEWLSRRDFVAVGEIGLDYYWDTTFKEQQLEAFRIQIDLAKKYQLPIVIHTRDSFDDAIDIVEELSEDNFTGIFHCFTGSTEEGQRVTKVGFYLGLGGVSTFKNGGLNDVIPQLDRDKIVLETDSPYLTPTPHRGKRNEPTYIPLIGEKVAEFTKIPLEEIAELTTQNAQRLFVK